MRRNLQLMGSAAIGIALAVQGVPTANAQEVDETFNVEEIVVTARKRTENIQETPLSVSAFTSNMIEAANIKTLDDIAKFTPGFSFDEDFQRSSSDRPVIRGQSTILGESGVSTFIDGVLVTGPILDYDLNDVERIEVIKGPQSALYGRNTYSGAISIITKSPTDEVTGRISLEGAEFNQFDLSASVRGPITDTLSASVTGRFYDRGGPFINEFDGSKVGQQRSKSISGVLYYEPNAQLDIRLRARWSELADDQPRLFTTSPEDNNCFFDNGGTFNGNGRYFCGEITEQAISIDDVRLLGEKGADHNTSWQTSISVDYELSDSWDLTYITGYNDFDGTQTGDFGYNDESLNPFTVHLFDAPFGPPPTPFTAGVVIAGPVTDFAQDIAVDRWDYSNELRLAYEGNGWNALIGGYYFDSKETVQSNRIAPPRFGETVEEAYRGEIARMVDVCTSNVGAFAGPCTPAVFNVNVDSLFPGGSFVDFAFANNGIGLTMLTLDADRDLIVNERRNIAAFAMVSRDVNERLTVSAEARFSSERKTSNTTEGVDTYDFAGSLISSTRTVTPQRQETFNDVSPRFTISYAATGNSNLYAVAARGTKPGGFNNFEVENIGLGSFGDETVWSYEIGAKNTLMDGRLIFNAAIFRNTITDYQLTQSIVIPLLNETTTVITNTGKVRVKGLELEAVLAPEFIPGLIFNANYAWTDSDILVGTDINEGKLLDTVDDGLVNNSLDPAGTPCDATCDNVLPGSVVGRQLPRQAKHMLNLGANYTRALTDSLSLVINGNLSYESKKFVQVHNQAWVGAATLVNASIGIETESLRVMLWVKNLTNEDAVVSASRFADEGASFQRIFMGNRRLGQQFGGTITQTF